MGRQAQYSDKYIENLLELRNEGKSVAQFCAGIGISRTTYYTWIDKYPEFHEAHEIGETLNLAWFDEEGRKAIKGIKVYDENTGKVKYLPHPMNTAVYIFMRKNRFGERDVQQDEPSNNAKLLTKIKEMLPT